mmetsp:Transcript_19441/g.38090  ORF Transcript_19441/g.38090 Transcript_19441/m.38090 type:complete len:1166 (+) Transcript_19441:250-3747(+)
MSDEETICSSSSDDESSSEEEDLQALSGSPSASLSSPASSPSPQSATTSSSSSSSSTAVVLPSSKTLKSAPEDGPKLVLDMSRLAHRPESAKSWRTSKPAQDLQRSTRKNLSKDYSDQEDYSGGNEAPHNAEVSGPKVSGKNTHNNEIHNSHIGDEDRRSEMKSCEESENSDESEENRDDEQIKNSRNWRDAKETQNRHTLPAWLNSASRKISTTPDTALSFVEAAQPQRKWPDLASLAPPRRWENAAVNRFQQHQQQMQQQLQLQHIQQQIQMQHMQQQLQLQLQQQVQMQHMQQQMFQTGNQMQQPVQAMNLLQITGQDALAAQNYQDSQRRNSIESSTSAKTDEFLIRPAALAPTNWRKIKTVDMYNAKSSAINVHNNNQNRITMKKKKKKKSKNMSTNNQSSSSRRSSTTISYGSLAPLQSSPSSVPQPAFVITSSHSPDYQALQKQLSTFYCAGGSNSTVLETLEQTNLPERRINFDALTSFNTKPISRSSSSESTEDKLHVAKPSLLHNNHHIMPSCDGLRWREMKPTSEKVMNSNNEFTREDLLPFCSESSNATCSIAARVDVKTNQQARQEPNPNYLIQTQRLHSKDKFSRTSSAGSSLKFSGCNPPAKPADVSVAGPVKGISKKFRGSASRTRDLKGVPNARSHSKKSSLVRSTSSDGKSKQYHATPTSEEDRVPVLHPKPIETMNISSSDHSQSNRHDESSQASKKRKGKGSRALRSLATYSCSPTPVVIELGRRSVKSRDIYVAEPATTLNKKLRGGSTPASSRLSARSVRPASCNNFAHNAKTESTDLTPEKLHTPSVGKKRRYEEALRDTGKENPSSSSSSTQQTSAPVPSSTIEKVGRRPVKPRDIFVAEPATVHNKKLREHSTPSSTTKERKLKKPKLTRRSSETFSALASPSTERKEEAKDKNHFGKVSRPSTLNKPETASPAVVTSSRRAVKPREIFVAEPASVHNKKLRPSASPLFSRGRRSTNEHRRSSGKVSQSAEKVNPKGFSVVAKDLTPHGNRKRYAPTSLGSATSTSTSTKNATTSSHSGQGSSSADSETTLFTSHGRPRKQATAYVAEPATEHNKKLKSHQPRQDEGYLHQTRDASGIETMRKKNSPELTSQVSRMAVLHSCANGDIVHPRASLQRETVSAAAKPSYIFHSNNHSGRVSF